MRPERLALLAVAVIGLLAWVAWRFLFGGATAGTLLVLESSGEVQRIGEGPAEVVAVGTALEEQDRLVAGPDGRAVLGLGARTRVTLSENTAVKVLGADRRGVRLELENGKVQATVKRGGGSVGIVSGGRELVEEDGDITVARDRNGTLVAEVTRGEARVLGMEGVDHLGAGERLVDPIDGDPLTGPVPDALLLNVVWPEARRGRLRSMEVSGKTEPGATVSGGGVTTRAGPDGGFRMVVPLEEGQNPVDLKVVNALGQSTTVRETFWRDTTPPSVGVQVHY
jgi:hypothetical protein